MTVDLTIPGKDLVFKKVVLRQTDLLGDLQEIIQNKFKEKGDPVDTFGDSFFTFQRLKEDGLLEQVILQDLHKPIREYDIPQGTTLELRGEFKLKSDRPKQCFSATFEKGKDMTMDYFSCKDCKFNWVCKPCAESCHKGHTIVEYIANHKPSWNCCYCVKHKKCIIVNSKTKNT